MSFAAGLPGVLLFFGVLSLASNDSDVLSFDMVCVHTQ